MRIGEFDFPDKCPEGCPFEESFMKWGQSAICGRCPVFVCAPCTDDDTGEAFCLVKPEDYRLDWAKAWFEWFRDGMHGRPEIIL